MKNFYSGSIVSFKSALPVCLSVGLALFFPLQGLQAADRSSLPRCLYVSSYHVGYAWSDGVESGLRGALEGQCELRQYDMDTKRKRSAEDVSRAVEDVIQIIATWHPDVVITSDDNAAKYLIVPHYSKSSLPFVFSGINWTVEEYGFPYPNTTGIVEVAPIEPMLSEAIKMSGGKTGVYIGAETLTEEKNFERIHRGAVKLGGTMEKVLVANAEAWQKAYFTANQEADFIVIGSNSGIEGWHKAAMAEFVKESTRVISVTNHGWMMHVSALGYTKIPEEHGQWAGEAAVELLNGANPTDIPIVTNRKWDLWVNQALVDSTNTQLSSRLTRKAKRFVLADD